MADLSKHAVRNRAQWDAWASSYVDAGRRSWAEPAPHWGIWHLPDAEVGALGDMTRFAGLDVVELGCGTAYFAAWFAKAGARVHGIDNSPAQLTTARALQGEFGIEFPLQLGSAEQLPYPDGSFDVAFSEYGASIWCDPYLWIPEAARVLRPGGRLIFLVNAVMAVLCMPDAGAVTQELQRPLRGMHRLDWRQPGDESVEFHLPHGVLIDLLGANGLRVERLVEVYPPAGATTTYTYMTAGWASRWPCEEIWLTRKV